MSVPRPNGLSPAAIAAASPPLEPPGTWFNFQGLLVTPKTAFSVSCASRSCGTLVLPRMMAPASLRALTRTASAVAGVPTRERSPSVESVPARSRFSLMVTGKPCNGPHETPCSRASSAAFASDSASFRTRMNDRSRPSSVSRLLFSASTSCTEVSSPDSRCFKRRCAGRVWRSCIRVPAKKEGRLAPIRRAERSQSLAYHGALLDGQPLIDRIFARYSARQASRSETAGVPSRDQIHPRLGTEVGSKRGYARPCCDRDFFLPLDSASAKRHEGTADGATLRDPLRADRRKT